MISASRLQAAPDHQTELTIQKALEFAGDNSQYQKKRLLFIAIIILTFALLTLQVAFMGREILVLFLAASGLGQLLCPVYLSFDICAVAIFIFSGLAALTLPFSSFLAALFYLAIGFFGRGFFACSLIYLNQIGGQRFRAWSLIVIFGIWGISSLLTSFKEILSIPTWAWTQFLILIPAMISCRYLLLFWKPSPYYLYSKKLFKEAKEVLNDMAEQNHRPPLVYGLEGQQNKDEMCVDKSPTCFDLLYEPSLQKITIPLLILWIFREYVYYGSFSLIPQVSQNFGKNCILISISETVAVLMSYPIRLKIRRVSTFFTLALIIGVASCLCSFTTVNEECWDGRQGCSSKVLYRISTMMIRFSIALTGNILISYTLQVYPVNVKRLAFSFMLGVSSAGSILLPWINQVLISAEFSAFIALLFASLAPLYFTPRLPETGGRVNQEVFVDWEKRAPLIPMEDWNKTNF